MRDKSLGILLIVLFGISGIVILMLAWLRPMPESERILTTVIGSAGLLVVLIRSRLLKASPVRADTEHLPMEDRVEDKS